MMHSIWDQGVVSLTFHELSKIFSRNLCLAEIVLVMRIWSGNFVRVPKAMLLGTRAKFQLQILTENVISVVVYFREIILESSRNVSETTPRWTHRPLGKVVMILNWSFSNSYQEWISFLFLVKLLPDECHRTSLLICQLLPEPSSMTPHGITTTHWVKDVALDNLVDT